MAVWNVILEVVVLGCVGWLIGFRGHFVGISWASGRVWLLMWVLYRLDMEMGAGGA